MGIDRIVYMKLYPSVGIIELDIDVKRIAGMFKDLGYVEKEYGSYTYMDNGYDSIRETEGIVTSLAIYGMAQVAIRDDRILMTRQTRYMEATLDALSGNEPSFMDDPAIRAVADSLGEPYHACIAIPENLFHETAPYYYTIPDDWGLLHQYSMAGLGYYTGKNKYIKIALYYSNADDAREDGEEIARRTKQYRFNTLVPPEAGYPVQAFSEVFELEETIVKPYDEGAVLALTFNLLPETRRGPDYLFYGKSVGWPDVLFLAPDTSQYIAE